MNTVINRLLAACALLGMSGTAMAGTILPPVEETPLGSDVAGLAAIGLVSLVLAAQMINKRKK